ncbi:MAG: histidine kinase dimerization/phosphoacceptor domain -containing protein [Chitinophagaceae bacterium]
MKFDNKRIICFITITIMLAAPLFSFSQRMWEEQAELLSQLRKTKEDTGRVHVLLKLGKYFMLREYYVYKIGNPWTQLDSAYLFTDQALQLSEALKYENGKNEATLLKGDVFIRKNEISAALTLLSTLQDSTRFRLLIILGRHYLFHKSRSQNNLDSSMLFLEQAGKLAPVHLSPAWQPERIHIKAMASFITEGVQQSKKLYQEMIDKISMPGNEEREALLWYELATLIPLRENTGITRLNCFEKMCSLYKKSGNEEREAFVLKTIADIHLVNGRLDLAEKTLLESLDHYKAIGYQDLHYIYDLLAVTYRNKGDFSKCVSYGLMAIESIEATNDSTSSLTFYSRLANMYRELGQPEKSVEWYSKTLNNRVFNDNDNFYKFRDAGFFARELIKIKREKEALAYILDINAKNKPVGVDAETCLVGTLAYCYQAVKQNRQAEKYYLQFIKLAAQLKENNEITTDVYYEIGQYFINKLQYEKALTYLQKALTASERTNSLSLTKDIHLMLYRADSGMGNYVSATQHLLKHKLLSDSIFNETKNWQIQELQVQFETAKREKDIKLLNNQNQLQRISVEQATRTKNITLAYAALLLIIVGLLFNRYLIKQRNNRKLEANQKELDQKNLFLETLNTEQEKLLKEKEWLIKEVHHRVKNNLQMVTSLLYSQSIYLEDETARLTVYDSLRRMQAMSLIHQKLYQDGNTSTIAMPAYISDLVRYLHESFDANNQIAFEQAIEPLDLDVSQAIPLGLIITEAIVNAIKYAFPDQRKGSVSLYLQYEGTDQLLLKISDNGIGLPAGFDTTEHHSLGLDLMRGLTKQLKGSFYIESNQGVHITFRFPILIK